MRRLLLVTVALVLALPGAAAAATLEVTSEAEEGPGTLGQTILDAGFGDTIELPAGTYLLTSGDVMVARDLELVGAGEGETVVEPSGGGEALDRVEYSGITVSEPRQPEGEEDSQIETQAQIIALIATVAIFLLILDLVRRRRLVERYALLWMSAAIALLVLAIWTDLLDQIADWMGIQEPANAIFILAFGVVFLLLLNFSVATSRLSEETKILAQESARLEQELREARGEVPDPGRERGSASGAEQAQAEAPVRTQDPA
jgi:hypothetical protein